MRTYRKYLYSIIDTETNSYDYDNGLTTTDDLDQVWWWLEHGVEQVACLDACSLEYLGYMDIEDLMNHKELDIIEE